MLSFGFNQVEVSGGDAWMSEPDMRKCMTGIRDIGASDIRMACVWQFIETGRGQFNWGPVDRAVNMARSFGLAPTLVVQFPPPGWGASATDFGNFAKAVAARYGSGGTGQVSNYEIMNEQNNIVNLAPPTPQQYTPYLKAAYLGIKSVHPVGSNVIVGGVMSCYGGFFTTGSYYFCSTLYQTGCKDYFDTMGFHWYSNTDQFVMEKPTATQTFFREMQGVRDAMVANGDSAKPIWVTELGFPYPTVSSLTTCRDWMKLQVDILNGLSWVGKWFIYNYRNSGTDTSNANNQWGVVDFNFTKKQPLWDYVATLSPRASQVSFTGTGSLSAMVRQLVPARFTGVGGLSAAVSSRQYVTASFGGVGSLGVEVFGRPHADFTGFGTLTAMVRESRTATATFSGAGTLSADVDITHRATAAFTGSGGLTCSVGQQRIYSHTFSGTTKPSTFTDFGAVSYYVQFSQAFNGNPSVDGWYYSGAVYNLDQLSADHISEVTLGAGGLSYDRSVMPLVRCDPAGANWAGATMHLGNCQIISCVGGVLAQRATGGIGAGASDRLGIKAVGSTYTILKNGVDTGVTWTDDTGLIPVTNKRTGFGFQHARSGGAFYGTAGISFWSGSDAFVTPVTPTVASAFGGSGALSASLVPKLSATFTGLGTVSAVVDVVGGAKAAPYTGSGSLTATVKESRTVSATFSGAGAFTALLVQRDATLTSTGSLTATVQLPVSLLAIDGAGGSSGSGTGTRTASWTMNIPTTDADTWVFVYESYSRSATSGTTTQSSVTYGSYAMTLLSSGAYTTGATPRGAKIYGLQNPPTGPQTVSCSVAFTGGPTGSVNGRSAAFVNVDSVAGQAAVGTYGTFTPMFTVSTIPGGMLFGACSNGSGSITGRSGTQTLPSGTSATAVQHQLADADTSTDLSWTLSTNTSQGACVAVNMAPVVAIPAASANYTGTGTLTATASAVIPTVAASFTGAGTLAAPLNILAPATGTGTLTVTATESYTRTALLAGAGTLTATVMTSGTVNAALAGLGTLTAVIQRTATASFTGTGGFTAVAQQTVTANFTSTGALTSTAAKVTVTKRTNINTTITSAATH